MILPKSQIYWVKPLKIKIWCPFLKKTLKILFLKKLSKKLILISYTTFCNKKIWKNGIKKLMAKKWSFKIKKFHHLFNNLLIYIINTKNHNI